MVQIPSWEANWFAASQEIPRISWNPKVHYRTHKRPPTVSILGQPNTVHIPTSHLLEIHPNIIHPSTPRSPQWFLSLRFTHQDPIHPPLLTHTRRMPSPSHFHGKRRFITTLTRVRHLSLTWTSTIQSIYPHPTSWRSILILSTHLRLGLPTGLCENLLQLSKIQFQLGATCVLFLHSEKEILKSRSYSSKAVSIALNLRFTRHQRKTQTGFNLARYFVLL